MREEATLKLMMWQTKAALRCAIHKEEQQGYPALLLNISRFRMPSLRLATKRVAAPNPRRAAVEPVLGLLALPPNAAYSFLVSHYENKHLRHIKYNNRKYRGPCRTGLPHNLENGQIDKILRVA
tara:strand:+ start:336 stop:707 length:372 start_codon:yes stop_codon:yes gene_type:complete